MAKSAPLRDKAHLSFTRRLLGLLSLGFLALIGAAVAVAWLQGQNEENADWVQHTLSVEAQIADFARGIERIETARRGVLLTGQPEFAEIMTEAFKATRTSLDRLDGLTRDNPIQRPRTAQLVQLLADYRQTEHEALTASLEQRRAIVRDFKTDRGVILIQQVRRVAQQMLQEERDLLAERDEMQGRTLAFFYGVLAITGLMIILVAAVTLLVMLRYTRELDVSRAELRRLNDDLETLVDERTVELQRANQEIQRFAYIVSHDLRSPLVNVMGFTAELDAARKTVGAFVDKLAEEQPDLVDKDVKLAVDEDLPEAIGFIRTSTQKMDRLINAILRLSREGRRTIAPEPIDATALTQTIVDSLQHKVTEKGAEIEIDTLPAITTDRFSLEQMLSNLIENALKYLQPGRPGHIRVTGRVDRDRTVYEVTDNGRGIDPRDHDRVFDLFRRSGMQDQPGEGIGLAHVRALAYRLGGLVDVRSELDRGSTFRLSLPTVLKAGDVDA
ncbi:sensor histidine kinase [Sphingomonas montanisoli]|uniref:histidine kinase n=1 Tax=Sphingomonas montanisoli TaxID=2606412 RepID=A0A5D9CBL4_9SPHN|nr:sensor histidine kinase [Sphingomonas montanisoli]TZG27511.1 histidine kinase [Sphingomonas montanisoli]